MEDASCDGFTDSELTELTDTTPILVLGSSYLGNNYIITGFDVQTKRKVNLSFPFYVDKEPSAQSRQIGVTTLYLHDSAGLYDLQHQLCDQHLGIEKGKSYLITKEQTIVAAEHGPNTILVSRTQYSSEGYSVWSSNGVKYNLNKYLDGNDLCTVSRQGNQRLQLYCDAYFKVRPFSLYQISRNNIIPVEIDRDISFIVSAPAIEDRYQVTITPTNVFVNRLKFGYPALILRPSSAASGILRNKGNPALNMVSYLRTCAKLHIDADTADTTYAIFMELVVHDLWPTPDLLPTSTELARALYPDIKSLHDLVFDKEVRMDQTDGYQTYRREIVNQRCTGEMIMVDLKRAYPSHGSMEVIYPLYLRHILPRFINQTREIKQLAVNVSGNLVQHRGGRDFPSEVRQFNRGYYAMHVYATKLTMVALETHLQQYNIPILHGYTDSMIIVGDKELDLLTITPFLATHHGDALVVESYEIYDLFMLDATSYFCSLKQEPQAPTDYIVKGMNVDKIAAFQEVLLRTHGLRQSPGTFKSVSLAKEFIGTHHNALLEVINGPMKGYRCPITKCTVSQDSRVCACGILF